MLLSCENNIHAGRHLFQILGAKNHMMLPAPSPTLQRILRRRPHREPASCRRSWSSTGMKRLRGDPPTFSDSTTSGELVSTATEPLPHHHLTTGSWTLQSAQRRRPLGVQDKGHQRAHIRELGSISSDYELWQSAPTVTPLPPLAPPPHPLLAALLLARLRPKSFSAPPRPPRPAPPHPRPVF